MKAFWDCLKLIKKNKQTVSHFSWLTGLVLSFVFPVLAWAQESSTQEVVDTSQLTLVPTRAVEPLQVLVSSDGEDGYLSGEVLSRRPLKASVLQFTLLDKYEGVAWRDQLNLPEVAQRIMPFYFPAIGADEELFLSVQAYDDFGNTVGSGHKIVELKSVTSEVFITDSQAFLDSNNQLNFSVFLTNGLTRKSYVPQVQIYQGLQHYGDLLEVFDQPIINLEPNQQEQLSFNRSFESPAPGVYEIVITLLDSTSREAISATHYQQIYKSGDFFKVIDLETSYTDEAQSKVNLELSGLSTVVLNEPVKMQVKLQHQQNIFLDKVFPLALQPGYFTKNIELQLPAYVKQLSGSATFFLQGKKIQKVEFASQPKLKNNDDNNLLLPKTDRKEDIGPLVLRPKPKFVITENQIWIGVIGCTVLLLLVVILSWFRSRFLLYLLVSGLGTALGIGSVIALTVGRDVFPMVEWSNPIAEDDMVFNPSSQDGFEWLPVKGRVFNYLTQTALLKGDAFTKTRLNLTSPTNRSYQFELDESLVAPNTEIYNDPRSGSYYFVLDLKALESANVIGRDTSLVWEEGEWQLQLLFFYAQKDQPSLWLATPIDTFGRFNIDLQPPLWRWQLFDNDGQALSEADFTNQAITVNFKCQDGLSQCIKADQSFEVRGNFCADGTVCNTDASRKFKVCDKAGNCQTESLEITGYDPVPPSVESFLIGSATAIAADENMPLSLRYYDPKQVEIEEGDSMFDAQLCGPSNPFFRFDPEEKLCVERTQACVLITERNIWRGESFNDECRPQCPEGYRFVDGSCRTICGNGAFTQDRLCLPFKLQPNEI